MAADESYRRQVGLLVRVLPLVAQEPCFALKGGTAINLFIRDMPRLSVDIDLTYRRLPGGRIRSAPSMRPCGALPSGSSKGFRGLEREDGVTKIVVRAEGVQIKVEVTRVLRGYVYEPAVRAVAPRVEDLFGYAEIPVVSFADLYAGKIVAALDRQHPRDLCAGPDGAPAGAGGRHPPLHGGGKEARLSA